MSTEQQESIYAARRAEHLARMTDHGVPPYTAEKCVEAWEQEAATRGRDRDSESFWDGAEVWIVEYHRRRA